MSLTNFSTVEGQKVRDTSVCFCRWGNQHAILRAAATTVAELLYAMLLHYTFITMAQWLKITEKVSLNIASEASYVYILSGQKLIKNAKKWSILVIFGKCDIFGDFQPLCNGGEPRRNYKHIGEQKGH